VNFGANLKPDVMIELPSMVIDCQKWVFYYYYYFIYFFGGEEEQVLSFFFEAKKLKLGKFWRNVFLMNVD
jgi:hypothetical protein